METTHPQIYVEETKDGQIVTRYKPDRRYDPHTIEGRTGQRAAEAIGTRYDAVLILANRIRELSRGDAAQVNRKYGIRTTALQEVEQGLVGYELFGKVYKNTHRRDRDAK